ncbi:choline-sulfatase [Pseudaestuariivita sp.]|uniref:choline-sulfatase n=1 Tax=Pseudaestuariivita sp. TaxID=2211669 RepID=UPI0040598F6F
MTQPNILIVMADQLAPQFTGAYGHPVVQTPHMDRLAKRGMRFDAAYCNSPLCAPSRQAFMTGKHISQIGAFDNASEMASGLPTFAHYLREAGYRTCLSGKMHFVGPDQLHGFEERLTTDVYPADLAWIPDWRNPDERIDKWYHNMDSVVEAGPVTTSFQVEYDEEATFLARRWLIERAMQKQHPFCMVLSLIHPHDPYLPRQEFWDLYDEDEIDLPQIPEQDDPQTQRVRKGIGADTAEITEDMIRRSRHGYYANVSHVDHNLGIMLKALEDTGQLENTIVIVTADHGDMLGERGLWYKMTHFEHSVRVPLIVAGPGVAEGTSDTVCSLVDLTPTLLDLAGADPELGLPLDGVSLTPSLKGETQDGTAISEYCAETTGAPMIMLRRGTFKYMACPDDPPMLFDLANDPDELVNLADDPDYAEEAGAFAAEVAARWDLKALKAEVIASQSQRRAVYRAMQRGAPTHWDWQPPRDASLEYVRNHMDYRVAQEKGRFPPFKP